MPNSPERYFEDYLPGSVAEFGSQTVEESEIIAFGKRFDPQDFHIDPEAASQGPFGGLIASGWHTGALMMRMFADNYLSKVSSLGSPGIDELRWLRPVRPGDTLRVRVPTATTSPQAPSQSIAVLPFINQSGSADDEYFSDGMTDELASALMKVNGLRVAAHSSTFTFKGKPADAREVGAKLHVAAVLEGTVRRAGSKLRITAQLVNASDGLALWSERYERESKDVFKVQDDITGAIVSALRLKLEANSSPNQNRREENVEAHDLYLRGRFLLLKRTEAGLRKSLDYFSQALAKDPGYAPAYDSIADAWSFLADAFVPPREGYPKAQTAAMKALELDPLDADAHSMLAGVRWWYA